MTHIVTLHGSDEARYKNLSYKNSTKGVIGPLLRTAIDLGYLTEDDMVEVYRDGVQVFLPCKALAFTHYTIKENDSGLVRSKYRPFDYQREET